jgi:hypothetical protein
VDAFVVVGGCINVSCGASSGHVLVPFHLFTAPDLVNPYPPLPPKTTNYSYWRGGFEVCEEGEEEENSLEAYSSKEGEGPIWLFFGCRRREVDWIYRAEMEGFLKQGALGRCVLGRGGGGCGFGVWGGEKGGW